MKSKSLRDREREKLITRKIIEGKLPLFYSIVGGKSIVPWIWCVHSLVYLRQSDPYQLITPCIATGSHPISRFSYYPRHIWFAHVRLETHQFVDSSLGNVLSKSHRVRTPQRRPSVSSPRTWTWRILDELCFPRHHVSFSKWSDSRVQIGLMYQVMDVLCVIHFGLVIVLAHLFRKTRRSEEDIFLSRSCERDDRSLSILSMVILFIQTWRHK